MIYVYDILIKSQYAWVNEKQILLADSERIR